MNAIVVYYSRTGTTRKVAEGISTALKCDVEEIIDTENRSGVIGWLKSGRDAGRKASAEIEPLKRDPASYDIVVIGTPMWNHTLATPVRAYITQYKDRFKRVAFFRTGASTDDDPFDEMESLCRKKPVATLKLRRKSQVEANLYEERVREFAERITTDAQDPRTKQAK